MREGGSEVGPFFAAHAAPNPDHRKRRLTRSRRPRPLLPPLQPHLDGEGRKGDGNDAQNDRGKIIPHHRQRPERRPRDRQRPHPQRAPAQLNAVKVGHGMRATPATNGRTAHDRDEAGEHDRARAVGRVKGFRFGDKGGVDQAARDGAGPSVAPIK